MLDDGRFLEMSFNVHSANDLQFHYNVIVGKSFNQVNIPEN